MKEIRIEDTSCLAAAAEQFVQAMGDRRIFAFYGKMGAGKTTFIKAVCEALGVEDTVASPTFAIVNEYADADGEPVYHFDFYRIKNLGEAYDIGSEEVELLGRCQADTTDCKGEGANKFNNVYE